MSSRTLAREQRSLPEASSLALRTSASLGKAPSFLDRTPCNPLTGQSQASARASQSLPDEFLFIDENYARHSRFRTVADALMRGRTSVFSSPVADVLFDTAKRSAERSASLESAIVR